VASSEGWSWEQNGDYLVGIVPQSPAGASADHGSWIKQGGHPQVGWVRGVAEREGINGLQKPCLQ
jgi:hypothetical protein